MPMPLSSVGASPCGSVPSEGCVHPSAREPLPAPVQVALDLQDERDKPRGGAGLLQRLEARSDLGVGGQIGEAYPGLHDGAWRGRGFAALPHLADGTLASDRCRQEHWEHGSTDGHRHSSIPGRRWFLDSK